MRFFTANGFSTRKFTIMLLIDQRKRASVDVANR